MSSLSDEGAAIIRENIDLFRRRARLHFGISYGIVSVIFLLFGSAALIFLFAQEIDRSKGSADLVRELQIVMRNQRLVVWAAKAEFEPIQKKFYDRTANIGEYLAALKRWGDAESNLLFLEKKDRLMNEVGYYSDIETIKSKEELETQLKGLTDHYESILLKDQEQIGTVPSVWKPGIDRVRSEIKSRRELLVQRVEVAPPAAAIKRTATNIDTLDLLRTSLVRFGGVAVILFLISILVPIYRYNVRLATYYLARADTLRLSGDFKIEEFGNLTRLLTPTHAFEKEPSTPIESVSSFVKEAINLVKKT